MSKIGIAISVYDKIDELATGIDIIRSWNLKDKAFISVCCNDPNSFERVKKLDVDATVFSTTNFSDHPKTNIRSRQFDSIRKSVGANLAKYVMHVHADAYAVNGNVVEQVIDKMNEDGVSIAFRGRGLMYANAKAIHGDVDDHFIFFKRDVIEERRFFEVDFVNMLQQCNTESLLAYQIKARLKPEEVSHYSDMRECDVAPGTMDNETFYNDGILHRAMNPFNVDAGRSFVHCATKELAHEHLGRQGVPIELLKTLAMRPSEPRTDDPEYLTEWLDG